MDPIPNKICTVFFYILLQVMLFATASSVYANSTEDEHIRAIVSTLLREKDQKIAELEARIQQLEQNQSRRNPSTAEDVQSKVQSKQQVVMPVISAQTAEKSIPKSTHEEASINSQLRNLSHKVDELKNAALEKNLDISGYLDINAKTSNSTDQTFSVGLLELDIAYNYDEHFGISTGLALCGNSANADYETAPAHITCGNSSLIGYGKGAAAIAVGLIDFHLFDSAIPPRGRIFRNQGFHIQAGRFDVPFGSDYQNFANKDRVTITSPITTVRLQQGGFNGDGVRSYGSWGQLNYSVYWTNGVYDTGTSVGGRLGMILGKNPFRLHSHHVEGFEFGVSHLSEFDGHENLNNSFYGVDASFGYGMLRIQNEFMLLKGHKLTASTYDSTGDPLSYRKDQQLAYHSTLIWDLEEWLDKSILVFARYGRWQPKLYYVIDSYNNNVVAINNISMLSLGFNYQFSKNLRLKFEYSDSLGTRTGEHYFDKRLGMAQIVLAF